jgi:hypothetical protein
MTAPKPNETCRNLCQLVSLQLAPKWHRNHRNHSLKREGDLVSPLRARSHILLTIRSRTVSATPWGLRLPGAHCPSNLTANQSNHRGQHQTDCTVEQLRGDHRNPSSVADPGDIRLPRSPPSVTRRPAVYETVSCPLYMRCLCSTICRCLADDPALGTAWEVPCLARVSGPLAKPLTWPLLFPGSGPDFSDRPPWGGFRPARRISTCPLPTKKSRSKILGAA